MNRDEVFVIRGFDFRHNFLSAPEIGDSLAALNRAKSSLKFLSLAAVRLHPKAAEKLQKCLIRTTWEVLDLSDNHIPSVSHFFDTAKLVKFENNV